MPHLRNCIITGSNGGIGKAAAIQIAREGHRVLMLSREGEKSQAALEEIRAAAESGEVQHYPVDLASRASIDAVSERLLADYDHLDVLVNNAGLFKRQKALSEDGVEMTLAVNYLAPVQLTERLLPGLRQGEKSRIVNVSSALYKSGRRDLDEVLASPKFDGQKAYADSKMLLVLHSLSLARRLEPEGITVTSLHPGVIGTQVFREMPAWIARPLNLFLASPETGARPVVRLAISGAFEGKTGAYFHKEKEEALKGAPADPALLERLEEQTARALGLATPAP